MLHEKISIEYVESLRSPKEWADAILEHGTILLTSQFSDQHDLSLANPRLDVRDIPKSRDSFQNIVVKNQIHIDIEKLGVLKGDLSQKTDQKYYDRIGIQSLPPYPKDRYFLAFSSTLADLPPGYMALQYSQPVDNSMRPDYDMRAGIRIEEFLILPTPLAKQLIRSTLKNPDQFEDIMQTILPGLTADRKRPKTSKIELIEAADIGVALRGEKMLGPTRSQKVLEFSHPIGEIEPLPKLHPRTEKILTRVLSYTPDLSACASEPFTTIDPRDLSIFLDTQSIHYDGQPLLEAARYAHYADRSNPVELDISTQYAELKSKEGSPDMPYGRLHISIEDKRLLTDGKVTIDLRRCGDRYALQFSIGKANFQQDTKTATLTGNMLSLVPSIGDLPPILKQLSRELDVNSQSSRFLLEGLRQILVDMKMK